MSLPVSQGIVAISKLSGGFLQIYGLCCDVNFTAQLPLFVISNLWAVGTSHVHATFVY